MKCDTFVAISLSNNLYPTPDEKIWRSVCFKGDYKRYAIFPVKLPVHLSFLNRHEKGRSQLGLVFRNSRPRISRIPAPRPRWLFYIVKFKHSPFQSRWKWETTAHTPIQRGWRKILVGVYIELHLKKKKSKLSCKNWCETMHVASTLLSTTLRTIKIQGRWSDNNLLHTLLLFLSTA